MVAMREGPEGGSVTILRPDGSPALGSPVYRGGIVVPWAIAVDGNDHIWISNFTSPSAPVAELCGYRTDTCPPGMKVGDPISPPGGYVGGGMQMHVDIGIDPAGNVWVNNNWQDWEAGIERVAEWRSTLAGGEGVVVFYGMAKPVRTPMIGPTHGYD